MWLRKSTDFWPDKEKYEPTAYNPVGGKSLLYDLVTKIYMEKYKNFLQKKIPEMVGAFKDYMKEYVKGISDVDAQPGGK